MSRTDINWDRRFSDRMVSNKKKAAALTNDLNENTDILGDLAFQWEMIKWAISSAFTPKTHNVNDGDLAEDDYNKENLYSILYNTYYNIGEVPSKSGPYRFTFNTWGFYLENSVIHPDDPQLMGKTAYSQHIVHDSVNKHIMKHPNPVIIELGCGTGAGANLIAKYMLPRCKYFALDMQKAAIETAKRLHANDNIQFVHGNAQNVPIKSGVADIVIINETHMAEFENISDEDAKVFSEVKRLLKPGGLFCWGNVIPDSNWNSCSNYLKQIGMKKIEEHDYTDGAIKARVLDAERVNLYCDAIYNYLAVSYIPIIGPEFRKYTEILLKNFYRHPGTKLFNDMILRRDTYKHMVFKKKKNKDKKKK